MPPLAIPELSIIVPLYNEAGVQKFKDDLAAFIKHTHGQKYNGKTPPRLTLFSPIPFASTKSRGVRRSRRA